MFNFIQHSKWHNNIEKKVFSYHFHIAKMFEEEANNVLKRNLENQLAKKRPNLIVNVISNFFVTKYPFKKEDVE
jgi:hypothetical protein